MTTVLHAVAPISLAKVHDKVEDHFERLVAEPIILTITDLDQWIIASGFDARAGSNPKLQIPLDADTPSGVDQLYVGGGAGTWAIIDANFDEIIGDGLSVAVKPITTFEDDGVTPTSTVFFGDSAGPTTFQGPVLELNDGIPAAINSIQIVTGYAVRVDLLMQSPGFLLGANRIVQDVDADVRHEIAVIKGVVDSAWQIAPSDTLAGLDSRVSALELIAPSAAVLVDGSAKMTGDLVINKADARVQFEVAAVPKANVGYLAGVGPILQSSVETDYIAVVEGGGISAPKFYDHSTGLTHSIWHDGTTTVGTTALRTNLNADRVDGLHASAFATAAHNQAATTITYTPAVPVYWPSGAPTVVETALDKLAAEKSALRSTDTEWAVATTTPTRNALLASSIGIIRQTDGSIFDTLIAASNGSIIQETSVADIGRLAIVASQGAEISSAGNTSGLHLVDSAIVASSISTIKYIGALNTGRSIAQIFVAATDNSDVTSARQDVWRCAVIGGYNNDIVGSATANDVSIRDSVILGGATNTITTDATVAGDVFGCFIIGSDTCEIDNESNGSVFRAGILGSFNCDIRYTQSVAENVWGLGILFSEDCDIRGSSDNVSNGLIMASSEAVIAGPAFRTAIIASRSTSANGLRMGDAGTGNLVEESAIIACFSTTNGIRISSGSANSIIASWGSSTAPGTLIYGVERSVIMASTGARIGRASGVGLVGVNCAVIASFKCDILGVSTNVHDSVAIIGCWYSEHHTSSGLGQGIASVLLGSRGVRHSGQNYSVQGGYANVSTPSEANIKWELDSLSGVGEFIGGTGVSPGDYAEYFESNDATDLGFGVIVVLVGKKIRKALATDSSEDYLGITSATAGVVVNTARFCWQGRYERDDFGAHVMGTPVVETNIVGTDETTTQDVILPVFSEDAAYDSELPYVPRKDRIEWHPVGLMGQCRVRIDSTVAVDDFIRSLDGGIATKETGTVYRRWRVMEIPVVYDGVKGYGVAIVYIR